MAGANTSSQSPIPMPNPQFPDVAIANLFNAHINLINVEKQLIWQRYSAMLIVNGFAFGFVTSNRSQLTLDLLGCFFGEILCVLWFMLNHFGWAFMWTRIKAAQDFKWENCWPDYINPAHLSFAKTEVDHIRITAQGVVILFGVAYLVFGLWCIWTMLYPTAST